MKMYQLMATLEIGNSTYVIITLMFQCNIGVGTPTPIKTINVNWAIQMNFQLPWNRSQIPIDIFGANDGYDGEARKKRELESDYVNDAKLYHFYKFVEDVLNR